MTKRLTCSQGHQWTRPDGGEAQDSSTVQCPICGGGITEILHDPRSDREATIALHGDRSRIEGAPLPDVRGYELLGILGRGGMGVVYKARQASLRRVVALKMIRAGVHADPDELVRFRAEAEMEANLQHPNIVQIYEVGEQDGQPFFSMEFVEGESLAKRYAGRPQPPRLAAQLIETIARAMHYAHEQGVIHRDLKPGNILLNPEGVPKVTDFGLAKNLQGDSAQTQTGTILGTPSYMAPEQARGMTRHITAAMDIYALGAILYELLTGRRPFHAATPMETVMEVIHQEPVPPSRLIPQLPRDLETICLKCLSKEPSSRYASAAGLADDLHRYLADQPILARPTGWFEHVRRWRRRNPLAAALTFFLAGLLLVAAISASAVAVWMADQRDEANILRDQAELSKADATDKLWGSYLAQAQAGRWSGQAGRRFKSLEALTAAADIRFAPALRDEAIACLALADLQVSRQRKLEPPLLSAFPAVDAKMDRYARYDRQGAITIHRLDDDQQLMSLPGPGFPVEWTLRFSPDGKILIAKYADRIGKVHVWDLERGKLAFVTNQGVNWGAVGFSLDGRQLVAAEPNHIRIYDLATGKVLREFQGVADPYALAFHPKEPWLAVSSLNGRFVKVLNLPTGKELRHLPHTNLVRGIAWRDDGALLASACHDRKIYLWRFPGSSDTPEASMEGHRGAVVNVAFQPGGKLLASMGWDVTTRLWDTTENKLLVTAPGHFLQFSGNGKQVAITGSLHEVGVWELAEARESQMLPGVVAGRIEAVLPDRRLLLAVTDQRPVIWDAASGKMLATLPGPAICHLALWLPGHQGILSFQEGGAELWPVRHTQPEGRPVLEIGPPKIVYTGKAEVGYGDVSSDGKKLLIRNGFSQATIIDWQQPDANPVWLRGHPRMASLALSRDGRWAATGTWQGVDVKIWDAHSGECLTTLPFPNSAQVFFSPDNQWLVISSGVDYRFLKVGSWEEDGVIPRDGAGNLPGPVAFSADGKLMALAKTLSLTHLIDVNTKKLIGALGTDDLRQITGLLFNDDASVLYELREPAVRAWDLRLIGQQLAARKLAGDWPSFESDRPAPPEVIVRVKMAAP